MSDEIREILDEPKILQLSYGCYISLNDYFKLRDYITNLQKENERLKAKCNNSTSHQINYEYFKTLYSKASKDIVIDDLVYKCEDIQKLIESNEKLDIEKNDHKSKKEKAVEYFKYQLENLDFYEDTKARMLCAMGITLLQNGSDASVKD